MPTALPVLQQTRSKDRFTCAKGIRRAHRALPGFHLSTCKYSCQGEKKGIFHASGWSQIRIKYPQWAQAKSWRECEPTTRKSLWQSLGPPHPLTRFYLSPPRHLWIRCLKSTPRAETVREKELGVVGKEEAGEEKAAWVALAIQRIKSRGRDGYANDNCIC